MNRAEHGATPRRFGVCLPVGVALATVSLCVAAAWLTPPSAGTEEVMSLGGPRCIYPHVTGLAARTAGLNLALLALPVPQVTEEVVSLAGRVVRKAASGAKLIFFDLRSEGAKIQVMCDARCGCLFISPIVPFVGLLFEVCVCVPIRSFG